jgi:hypothetical protein
LDITPGQVLDVHAKINDNGQLVFLSDYGFISAQNPNIYFESTDVADLTTSWVLIEQVQNNVYTARKRQGANNEMLVIVKGLGHYAEYQEVMLEDVSWNVFGEVVLHTNMGSIKQADVTVIVPRSDIDQYVTSLDKHSVMMTTKKLASYDDVSFERKTGGFVAKNTRLSHAQIAWTEGGTPRIQYDNVFISANKRFVTKISKQEWRAMHPLKTCLKRAIKRPLKKILRRK